MIRELGQPYAEFPDLGILAYTWEMRTDKILWAVGVGEGRRPARLTWIESTAC